MPAQLLAPQPQPASILHINSLNTAFMSPGEITWDNQSSYSTDTMDVVSWNYYALPPSPPASVGSNADDSPHLSAKVITPCITPEQQSEIEQRPCLPTSQVFDLDGMEVPSSSSSASSPPLIPCQLTLSSDSGPGPRKAFATIGGAKKGRGNGERITTKNFVPPDVTGLSKREARLLKNRAAAFLSRQRKREEFEAMEIRVKELEEENVRLQELATKGKKYDDLVASVEQLRVRLSMAERRERELTAELANQTATKLAVKAESHDLGLPSSPYSPYAAPGQTTALTMIKQSLLSSLPSLLSLPQQTSLPINFTVPLTGTDTARPSTTPLSHRVASCDIKDEGQPRFGQGSSADVESLKVALGGGAPETCQFDIDGLHGLGSFMISFDASPTKDGRGGVHVHVSERAAKPTIQTSRQRPPSLASQWSGTDSSFSMTCYASPPLSIPVNIPSPGGIDHLGVLTGAGNAHSRMGFDAQLISSGYTPFPQHGPEQTFDYYPGMIPE